MEVGSENKDLTTIQEENKDMHKVDSGNRDLNKTIQQWMKWDKNETTKKEVQNLIDCKNWEELGKIMLKTLEFGTAGIRGKMGAGFGCMNDLVIIQVSQGLLAHLQKTNPNLQKCGVVLGFDGRHNSERWARLTAGVFLRAGVPVYLFSTTTPTPYVPFTVVRVGAAAGVMVTASHNPKQDNGYKVFWSNGPQIKSPIDKEIQKCILENQEPAEGAFEEPGNNHSLLKAQLEETNRLYMDQIKENIFDFGANSSLNLPVVYTAMHGVGFPYVKEAWKTAGFKPENLYPVVEQCDPDPEFPTVEYPNPEEGASSLDLAVKTAASCGSKYILANDPDADRLALAQKINDSWKVLNGNEIGALLGWWTLQCFVQKHPEYPKSQLHFLASTVSSKMLKTIADAEGLNFTETLTGFKYLGNVSDEYVKKGDTVLLAFEQAIGFMCGTAVLDKDGVSAFVVISELIAHLDKKGINLTDQLQELYKKYGYHYTLESYYLCYDPQVTNKIFARIRQFQGTPNSYPGTLCSGKYCVDTVRDLTTGIDTAQPDNKALLPSSKSSHMITFRLTNGVVVTLRTSGTEPKIKYYAEFCAKPENSDWKSVENDLMEVVGGIVDELLQPEKNNLIAKS